jgi:DtxR family Mn-dependent transcriptional regulator
MNVTIENYLQTIYFLFEIEADKGIKSIDVAKKLNISRASVSVMIRKLVKEGYIIADKYSKIFLTDFGKEHARKIMYKHRIIEVFLTETLGYSDILKIHEEAHKLEHSFSDESIKRLDELMNYPKKTIAGKTIPRRNKNGRDIL